MLPLTLAALLPASLALAETAAPPPQPGGLHSSGQTAAAPFAEQVIDNFYTDSARTTMKADDELLTWWNGLGLQEQEALKQGCSEESIAALPVDLPESTLNACRKINALM